MSGHKQLVNDGKPSQVSSLSEKSPGSGRQLSAPTTQSTELWKPISRQSSHKTYRVPTVDLEQAGISALTGVSSE